MNKLLNYVIGILLFTVIILGVFVISIGYSWIIKTIIEFYQKLPKLGIGGILGGILPIIISIVVMILISMLYELIKDIRNDRQKVAPKYQGLIRCNKDITMPCDRCGKIIHTNRGSILITKPDKFETACIECPECEYINKIPSKVC